MKIVLLAILLAVTSLSCVMSSVPQPARIATNPPKSTRENALPVAKNSKTVSAYVTAAETLNIRSGPGTKYPSIKVYLVRNEQVTVYSCFGNWARINTDNEHPRWVNSIYLSDNACGKK